MNSTPPKSGDCAARGTLIPEPFIGLGLGEIPAVMDPEYGSIFSRELPAGQTAL